MKISNECIVAQAAIRVLMSEVEAEDNEQFATATKRCTLVVEKTATRMTVGSWPKMMLNAFKAGIIVDKGSFELFVAHNNPSYGCKFNAIKAWAKGQGVIIA